MHTIAVNLNGCDGADVSPDSCSWETCKVMREGLWGVVRGPALKQGVSCSCVRAYSLSWTGTCMRSWGRDWTSWECCAMVRNGRSRLSTLHANEGVG